MAYRTAGVFIQEKAVFETYTGSTCFQAASIGEHANRSDSPKAKGAITTTAIKA